MCFFRSKKTALKGPSGLLLPRLFLHQRLVAVLALFLTVILSSLFLLGEQAQTFDLFLEKLLQPLTARVLFGVLAVVRPAVGEHQVDVLDDLSVARVLHPDDARAHRAQVHRLLDDLVVVGRVSLGDGPIERPAVFVLHHRVEQVLEDGRVEHDVELGVDGAPSLPPRATHRIRTGSFVFGRVVLTRGRRGASRRPSALPLGQGRFVLDARTIAGGRSGVVQIRGDLLRGLCGAAASAEEGGEVGLSLGLRLFFGFGRGGALFPLSTALLVVGGQDELLFGPGLDFNLAVVVVRILLVVLVDVVLI